MDKNTVVERPWGRFLVIHEEGSYKLKRIEVKPGHRLSYQFHNKRSEVWTIVQGSGEIVIDGNKGEFNMVIVFKLIKNQSIEFLMIQILF